MTYQPKVGDIVSLTGTVVDSHPKIDNLFEIKVPGRHVCHYITADASELTLVSRPKRELKPGDRVHRKGSLFSYIWVNGVWFNLSSNRTCDRDALSFDTYPEEYDFFPRNETAES